MMRSPRPKRLINGDAPALFEAAFEHGDVVARADVLERLRGGGWRMIEVKSTTRVKDVFILDTAIQLWILRGAGVDVRDACILTLDTRFVRTSEPPDPQALFRLHRVMDRASGLLDGIGDDVRKMHEMIARADPPEIATGDHCHDPYPCPYWAHCTRNAPQRDHPLDELPRLGGKRRAELDALGIVEVRDIPAEFPMSFTQHLARRAVAADAEIVRGDLGGALELAPPVRHLDFETFAPAVPRFPGTRPYEGIPFLFSVRTERDGGPTEQVDYLHECTSDPRPNLVERLLDALGRDGSICVYSRFEARVIRSLVQASPQHAVALERLLPRLVDLHRIVRRHYYHPGFRGSLSLKAVLPTMTNTHYDDLAITDGRLAAVRYMETLRTEDETVRRRTFADLRAYCHRDTAATVAVVAALRNVVARPRDT